MGANIPVSFCVVFVVVVVYFFLGGGVSVEERDITGSRAHIQRKSSSR